MSVFQHPDYDAHEQVVFCHDPDSGLRAIIAIHDTRLGPALGGCRMWPYRDDDEALGDALRLARGMTYKSALAGLSLGGGKSVIIGDPQTRARRELMLAMGRCVGSLGGRYIAAEDSGTGVEDLKAMRSQTPHVVGVADKPTDGGQVRSGDPSPSTALGVLTGMRAAVAHALGRDDLSGLRVAIQGVGSVGFKLAGMLAEQGARLWVSDLHPERAQLVAGELGAQAVAAGEIFALDVDVFAPCALGGVLDERTVGLLRAPIVAGAANNQLREERCADLLARKGTLYCPDYVINAGGVIDVACELRGYDPHWVSERIARIGPTLHEIFARAEREGTSTRAIADALARERLRGDTPDAPSDDSRQSAA